MREGVQDPPQSMYLEDQAGTPFGVVHTVYQVSLDLISYRKLPGSSTMHVIRRQRDGNVHWVIFMASHLLYKRQIAKNTAPILKLPDPPVSNRIFQDPNNLVRPIPCFHGELTIPPSPCLPPSELLHLHD